MTLVVRGQHLPIGERTLVMGIVNVTPDSFSGDGLLDGASSDALGRAALVQAQRMVAEGADLIDIGGESTRPGHTPVAADQETHRVVGAIAAIREALPGVPISLDTAKASVAEAGLEAGADILNDVSAVTAQAALAGIAAAHGVPYVVMHSRTRPDYVDLVAEVVADLHDTIDGAIAAGCRPRSLIVDPGIGFGKTAEQNLLLLGRLRELRSLGVPILLGSSRKSTIGKVLALPADERLEGTLATTVLGIAAGVDIVRVHDVAANVRAVRMADAIVRGGWQDAQVPTPSARGERQ